MWDLIVFWIISAVLLSSAMVVVMSRNAVFSALSLIIVFFNMSLLWMSLQAEFLAIVLILVYVGAVMVLFLFVVMMFDIKASALGRRMSPHFGLACVVVLGIFLELVFIFSVGYAQQRALAPDVVSLMSAQESIYELGWLIFTNYVYVFEIAAVLLLLAMVAATSLVYREVPLSSRKQNISRQVAVRKEDRLEIHRI